MKKLYDKNELSFALVWIAIYCALQSFANPLNEMIGVGYSASAVFCILQTVVLFAFVRSRPTFSLLCAAFCFGIGKSLERCRPQLFTGGNCLPYRVHALCRIPGGIDLPWLPVHGYRKE